MAKTKQTASKQNEDNASAGGGSDPSVLLNEDGTPAVSLAERAAARKRQKDEGEKI